MRGSRWVSLTALALGTACQSRTEQEDAARVEIYAEDLGTQLLAELQHVVDVITPGRLLLAIALVLAAVVLRRTVLLSVRIAWRLGWDPRRRLAQVRSYVEIALVLGVGLMLGWMVFKVVPALTTLAATSTALVAAIALPGGLQDLAAGISLAGRNRFVEGDQVEVGSRAGTVRHIGLLRTMLRLGDGGSLWLPNREIVRTAVQVGREQQALPVTVELPARAGHDPRRREQLRRVAHLSPYRRAGSRPTIARDGDRWVLSFQTWCTRRPEIAAQAVAGQLRSVADEWEEAS